MDLKILSRISIKAKTRFRAAAVFSLIKIIKLYRVIISPYLGSCCRFHPSCSQYCIEAVNDFGLKGFWLAILRIMKCHPFAKGGFDPVPAKNSGNDATL